MVQLAIAADTRCLKVARMVVREVAIGVLSPERCEDLVLAAGELLTNAIEHGSPAGELNQVTLAIEAGQGALRLVVTDEGPGFDAGAVPEPDPLGEHGRGVHLVRQLVDVAQWDDEGFGTRAVVTMRVREGEVCGGVAGGGAEAVGAGSAGGDRGGAAVPAG